MEPLQPKRRNAVVLATTRTFRRILYGALGVVLSSYVVLFILVITRHLDQSAEDELRRAAVQSLATGSRSRRSPAGAVTGLGPSNVLGMDRFHERWAAVSRILRVEEADPTSPKRRVQMCSRPVLKNPPGPLVALASFPGSGNTWVRFLLQQATGYLTGSVYRDYSLKRNGFPAENIANGSVLLVKTHEWGEEIRKKFQKVVLLLREPYGSLLAEFNRRSGGHVGHASAEKFHRSHAWRNFTILHSKLWVDHTLDWLQYDGPLLVLHYDVITQNLASELVKLLQFLEVNVTWPVFQCVLRNKEGIFRRAKRGLQFDPFDPELRTLVEGYSHVVYTAVRIREEGPRTTAIDNNTSVGMSSSYIGPTSGDASSGHAETTKGDDAVS